MIFGFTGLSLTCAAVLLLLAGPLRAEGEQDPFEFFRHEALDMNAAVETASRRDSTVGQTPAAVFVITSDMIRRSGATAIPELFRMVPGMSVARIDGNKWAVGVRGFNTRFSNKLLVMIDGRSLYTPLTAGVFWDTVDYPLEDIERIEIIRGPGASLWGANAVNGIVHIITKPAKDTAGGLLTGGFGTEERGFGSIRYGGGRKTLQYRVFGKAFGRDPQSSPEGDPNDRWRGASAGTRLDWRPSEPDAFTVDAGYSRAAAGRKDRFPLVNGPPFARNFPEVETTDVAHVLGRWSRQGGPGASRSMQVSWDRFDRSGDNGFANTSWDTYDLDYQHGFALGERQKLIAGAGYRYTDARLANSVDDNGFYLSWLDNHPHQQVFSGFLQDEIALAPERLALTLGTKLEHNDYTGLELQPTARLLWTLSERRSVWAAVSRAVRTRTFTENDSRFTSPPADPAGPPTVRTVANRGLNPEEVWAYELGGRAQAAEAVTLDAALFYNVYHDLRANRINPALAETAQGIPLAASQFVSAMDGESYGAELTAHWGITRTWRLYGAYSILETLLRADPGLPASGRAAAEAAAKQNPRHQAYARSSWNLGSDAELDLTGRYVDRLGGFNPSGLPGVSDTVDAYGELDARVCWRPRPELELTLAGQNLLASRHAEFGTNPFIRSPLVEIQRGVYAKMAWRF